MRKSEIEGNESTQETPNREIGFGFVSCSCRACVRASGRGEAVWACERGVFVNAGGLHSNISSCDCAVGFCVFAFICKGFRETT